MATQLTRTSAPNAPTATSVSPLDQSGSTNTNFPMEENPEMSLSKRTYKANVLWLAEILKRDCCMAPAVAEAQRGLTSEQIGAMDMCIDGNNREWTQISLRGLANSISGIFVVTEYPGGTQERLEYSEEVCLDVLRYLKNKGIKAWIELE